MTNNNNSNRTSGQPKHRFYINARKNDIDPLAILLEPAQGKNLNGNMFYLLKELETNKIWSSYTPYFVVVEEKIASAVKRFANYGFSKSAILIRDSQEYQEILATAKYLITDNSFPAYMCKRNEQVYLNTWHGTPIKGLGRIDIDNAVSMPNLQKNFFAADYNLYPNQYTRDIFLEDYMLTNLTNSRNLLLDYPRNSILYDADSNKSFKEKLGLGEKEILAYMPTWRGLKRGVDAETQNKQISDYLYQIDSMLNENQLLYVNLHFLVSNSIDFTNFNSIKPFPSEYETYDFLRIADILISDYSSVIFDFAATNKRIFLFAYDYDEYLKSKPTYININNLPFAISYTVPDLIHDIETIDSKATESFISTYCSYKSSSAPYQILDLLINNNINGLNIEGPKRNGKANLLVHIGKLGTSVNDQIAMKYIDDKSSPDTNMVLSFENGITEQSLPFLKRLPHSINYLALTERHYMNAEQYEKYKLFKSNGTQTDDIIEYCQYESHRILGSLKIDNAIMLLPSNIITMLAFGSIVGANTTYELLPDHIMGIKRTNEYFNRAETLASKLYDEVIAEPDGFMHDIYTEIENISSAVKMDIQKLDCRLSSKNLCFKIRCRFIGKPDTMNLNNSEILFGDKVTNAEVTSVKGDSWIISFVLPIEDILSGKQKIAVRFIYEDTLSSRRIINMAYERPKDSLHRLYSKLLGKYRFPNSKENYIITIKDSKSTFYLTWKKTK